MPVICEEWVGESRSTDPGTQAESILTVGNKNGGRKKRCLPTVIGAVVTGS